MSLAKLGLKDLRLWDADIVEPHNLPNQIFLTDHIGQNKAEAVQAMCPWANFTVRPEMYEGQEPLREVVFLLVDRMDVRKEIFEKHIRMRPNVRLMIETRVGSDCGYVYTIQPSIPAQIKFWQSKWFPDDQAEVSSCGSVISVGPTGDIISGYAVWQLMNWLLNQERKEDEESNPRIIHQELFFATHGDLLSMGVAA